MKIPRGRSLGAIIIFAFFFHMLSTSFAQNVFPVLNNVLYPDSPAYAALKANGINMEEIPYMVEHVAISYVSPRYDNFYDSKKTQQCLGDKRVLVLGDSVLEEFDLDISTLLSGLAGHDVTQFDDFIEQASAKTPKHLVWRLPNDVTIYHHTSRRNLTIVSDVSATYIRHRFVGHYDIKQNYYGVRTLNFPSFVNDELLCMLGLTGEDVVCPLPDYIILNAAHHDVNQPMSTFDIEVRKFLDFVRNSYRKQNAYDVKIIWKGVLISGAHETKHRELLALDEIARKITKDYNIPYVDATALLAHIPRYQDLQPSGERPYQIYTQDRIHHGGIARGHDMKKVGTVSMLTTQAILHTICGGSALPSITGPGGATADIGPQSLRGAAAVGGNYMRDGQNSQGRQPQQQQQYSGGQESYRQAGRQGYI